MGRELKSLSRISKSVFFLSFFYFHIYLLSPADAAVQFTTIASFNGVNGAAPSGSLCEGPDGSLYGATSRGGIGFEDNPFHGYGVAFKASRSGSITAIHSFNGGFASPAEGEYPTSGLILGADKNFYGVTDAMFYKITPEGTFVYLQLILGINEIGASADGNFYGTSTSGGGGNDRREGTIVKLSPAATNQIFVNFLDNDNAYPAGGLIQGTDGNLYGTTIEGGHAYGVTIQLAAHYWISYPVTYGTVFKVNTNGILTTLVGFDGPFNGIPGAYPRAAMIQGSDGNFYGTTVGGSDPYIDNPYGGGASTVFRMASNGTITNLHSFVASTDGTDPEQRLVEGTDHNFYGMTVSGGPNGVGTIFQISRMGEFKVLYAFTGGTDGGNPHGSLIQGTDGNFYGTTSTGGSGTNNYGTIFRLTVPLDPELKEAKKSGESFLLTWTSVASLTYQIQCSSNLSGTNWVNLNSPVLATNGTTSAACPLESHVNQFYRVLLLPH